MSILEFIGKRVVFADGGMGTILQSRGLRPGELPESWNLLRPDEIEAVHSAYLSAGADFVLANTFGANGAKLADSDYEVAQLVGSGVKIARRAADAAEKATGRRRFVALDVGPTGHLLRPSGDLDFDDAYAHFAEAVSAGAKAGADLVFIETMADTYELKAAVLAAKENSKLPVFATVAFNEGGNLLTGGSVEAVVALLEGLRVDALGMNCGLGSDMMLPLFRRMRGCASVPIIVKPNAGMPRVRDGRTVFDVGPDEFAADVKRMAEEGACVVGGCCGTTPAHLAAACKACAGISPPPIEKKSRTVVSSYTQAVEIRRGDTVIIGERINPTGKKRLKQAIKEGDEGFILREGIAQQDAGAHILDVNVGVPGIDEPAVMDSTVRAIQGVINLPLQIDTSNIDAMELALRHYNGKAMVNSVNGKRESMDAVLPLVAKYGGVVVALALDEDGIPPTADGRIAIAGKIVRRAAEFGIEPKDIVVDVLCLAVSADAKAPAVTLEAVRRVSSELGLNTVLGVSNVSFGLPLRSKLNAAFYAHAMAMGLSSAIINPCDAEMMAAYRSHRALTGADANCEEYIRANAALAQNAEPQPAIADVGARDAGALLTEAICRGLKGESSGYAAETLRAKPPMDVINENVVPALDEVGKGFESGRIFLPQLLQSAEAAAAAFEVIRRKLAASGEGGASKGKIIVATVEGDIHDIGKNIVKALLENYGYEVIDLGRDVAPERIVREAIAHDVKLVGLSALMTTTVGAMEETIRQLHSAKPDCKVLVGGAVLTAEYAREIHADFYSKDAMGSVRVASIVFPPADP